MGEEGRLGGKSREAGLEEKVTGSRCAGRGQAELL